MEKQSVQIEKRRKFLMVLPLLALPFITLIFWAMGGGSGNGDPNETADQGLNTELPKAQLEERTLDKLSLYRQSPRNPQDERGKETFDSIEVNNDERFDNYYKRPNSTDSDAPYGNVYSQTDPNEQRIHQRLAELERIIEMQEQVNVGGADNQYHYSRLPLGDTDTSLERLEDMMQRMSGQDEPDAELQVLDNMLEKIIDIQHPERAKEKIRNRSLENRGSVFAVGRQTRSNTVPYLHRPIPSHQSLPVDSLPDSIRVLENGPERNRFHGIDKQKETDVEEIAGIPAVIPETQTVVSGANIKIMLGEDIYVNGILIPAGHFVVGECSLQGERLQVKVSGIQYRNYQLPVSLAVFDRNGTEGIRIPGSITRDAAADGTDRALQSMQLMSFDPSIGTQAAGAGIEAAKGLLSKKTKLIRVTVKAGHPILLFDEQSIDH